MRKWQRRHIPGGATTESGLDVLGPPANEDYQD